MYSAKKKQKNNNNNKNKQTNKKHFLKKNNNLSRCNTVAAALICELRLQIIFHFLWDHWAYCGIFENGVQLLMYTLEGESSVANFITAYEESQ